LQDKCSSCPTAAARIRHRYSLVQYLPLCHSYPLAPPNTLTNTALRHPNAARGYGDANFAQVIAGVDPDPKNNVRMIERAKDYWLALHPYSAGGGYVTMIMAQGEEQDQNHHLRCWRGNFALASIFV